MTNQKIDPHGAANFDRRFAYTIPRSAELASISRSQIYIEIQSGRLTAIKIGGRTLVRHDDLIAWLTSRPTKFSSSSSIGSSISMVEEKSTNRGAAR